MSSTMASLLRHGRPSYANDYRSGVPIIQTVRDSAKGREGGMARVRRKRAERRRKEKEGE